MTPRRLLLATCLLAALLGCRDDGVRRREEEEPPPEPTCGDDKLDEGEACDGADLGGESCVSRGFDFGTLTCGADCRFVTERCVKLCGNGKIDSGESCDGALGPLTCPDFGYRSCTPACGIENAHCGWKAFVAGLPLPVPLGSVAAPADLEPKGEADLAVAMAGLHRINVYRYTVDQGFLGARTLAFLRSPALPLAADLDGDGRQDLAAINDDGSVDRYLDQGATGFAQQAYPSGGCKAQAWLGAGHLRAKGPLSVAAFACDEAPPRKVLVFHGATAPAAIAEAGLLAAAIGDADRDGYDDLLLATDAPALVTRRGPALAAAAPVPLPYATSALAAADLDGDLDLDLAVLSGGQVALLENTGTAFVERFAIPAAPLAGLRFADLDLDGRPDLLWQEAAATRLLRTLPGFQVVPQQVPISGTQGLACAPADVDGDGDLDLLVLEKTSASATRVAVWLNPLR